MTACPQDAHAPAAERGSTPAPGRRLDPDSCAWLDALDADAPRREEAIARLHALLLRAARSEIGRRRSALAHVRGEELDDLAMQAADDALVAVLAKRDQYRGESRFSTWAYKFALLEASVRLRRRAWRDRELPLDAESWALLPDGALPPEAAADAHALLAALRQCISERLTPHQRSVLIALAIEGVPIDVLSERLGTSRGALYKALHDARRKLRAELAARGFAVQPQRRT